MSQQKTNQAAADLKEKLMKEWTVDKIKQMFETFIDKISFTIPIWYCIMVNKHEAKALYPNMMSLLELCVIIPSSTAEVERGFSAMKLFCTRLRASMLPSTLDILMQICLCGDSLTFEKVVDIYRNSVVDENKVRVKPNDAQFLSEKY